MLRFAWIKIQNAAGVPISDNPHLIPLINERIKIQFIEEVQHAVVANSITGVNSLLGVSFYLDHGNYAFFPFAAFSGGRISIKDFRRIYAMDEASSLSDQQILESFKKLLDK